MFDVFCVTSRTLCRENFAERIEAIAACRPRGIVLREKDLSEEDYFALAASLLSLCRRFGTPLILHSFPDVALRLGVTSLHLPLPALRSLPKEKKAFFTEIGASCHSVEEAKEAERLGCTYLFAGHIFPTDCKKGLPGRGLDFLRAVLSQTALPVYAIGGIGPENVFSVKKTGAAGVCVMSSLMTCPSAAEYLSSLREAAHEA